jgi:hypothetical protein
VRNYDSLFPGQVISAHCHEILLQRIAINTDNCSDPESHFKHIPPTEHIINISYTETPKPTITYKMKVVAILFALIAIASAFPQAGKTYPLKLQPELDNINIEEYLKNDKLLSLQIKCVVHDGPCDSGK